LCRLVYVPRRSEKRLSQVLFDLTEDQFKLPYSRFEQMQASFEDFDQAVLNGSSRHNVVDVHVALLAIPIKTSDALFNSHGIPVEVIVNDDVAELKVATLPTSLGGHHYLRHITKLSHCCILIPTAHCPSELEDRKSVV